MTQCLTPGCEREPKVRASTIPSKQINEVYQEITKGPQPKLPITIYQRYGISEILMQQTRQWRPHPSVLSDRPLCPSCRFAKEHDLKEEISRLEDEADLCSAVDYHSKEVEV